MNESTGRLKTLLLEDDDNDRRLITRALERYGLSLDLRVEQSEGGLRSVLADWTPEIVLSDYSMPAFDALRALEVLRECRVEAPVLLVSGTIGEEAAVEVVRAGAADYVSKLNLARLGPVLERIIASHRLEREHELTKRALAENEARYRYLFDHVPSGVLLLQDDRIVECNAAAAELYGFAVEEMIGMSPLDFSPDHQPDGRPSSEKALELIEAAKAGERQKFEWLHVARNGSAIINEILLAPLAHVAGANLQATVRDVTEERQADQARRRSEANYRALFEGIPEGVFLLRRDGTYVDCNERVEALFGWSRDWLIGRTFLQISPDRQPDGRSSCSKAKEFLERAASGEAQAFEWEVVLGNGEAALVEVVLGQLEGGGSAELFAVGRDITAERELRRREREQQAILSGILEGTSDIVFVKDLDGRYLHMNAAGLRFLQQDRGSLIGRRDDDIFPPEHARRIRADDEAVLASGTTRRLEEGIPVEGESRCLETTKGVCRDEDGRVIGVFGISRDVTEARKASLERLKLSRALEQAGDAVMITDLEKQIEFVNPAFERITGYAASEVKGETPRLLRSSLTDPAVQQRLDAALSENQPFTGLFVNRRRDGERYYADTSVAPVRDEQGEVTHYVMTHSDVTEKLRTERELERLSNFDPVTELANRGRLLEQLDQMLVREVRDGKRVAVFHIDLDGFGRINQSLGQKAGDEILRTIAGRLPSLAGESALLGRSAGDSFVVLVPESRSALRSERVIERIQAGIAQPIRIEGREVLVTAGVGVAFAPDDAVDAEQLMHGAEAALNRVRDRGNEQVAFFAQRITEESRQWIETHTDLMHALEREEFRLEFQPKVRLEDGRVGGAEALLRWEHPTRGRIGPDQFVPLLEKTGLIVPVGEWVIRRACEQIVEWQSLACGAPGGFPDLRASVNLSFEQFRQKDLAGLVRDILAELSVSPRFLELELTETSLAQDPEAAEETLRALRGLGVTVSLDDFGKGYSSLTYLRRFPIDVLKIDREFINWIGDSTADAAILRSVLRLSRDLGIEAVAEGVETEEQLRFLMKEGCDYVQGYYFSRPLAPEAFRALLDRGGVFSLPG